MIRLICLLIGYACGLFQTSYIYGKTKGIDIRELGSGNAGTTNALRELGAKAGAITFIGDCLKCVVAVIIVKLIFGNSHTESIKLLGLYAGAGTILGHNFPFYMNFKGGKGIAATAGLILSFDWRVTLIALATFLLALFITHYVSVGSLLVYVVFLIGMIVFGQLGMWGMEQHYLNEMYFVTFLLMLLAFYRHKANIKRLFKGQENKTYLGSKKKRDKAEE